MTIPIANPLISEAAKDAVRDVLDSGQLAAGEEVRAFEAEFAEYIGVDHAVATTNGTTALHAMLEAAGIGEGDAVVTTPFSFIASANAIVHAGAKPVFGGIDPETYNLDPETVREVLEERDDVEAVLAVHLYGLPADMDALEELSEEHDVYLFEDAAQAHGATFEGTKAGAIGDAAAVSFYPTKNMTCGEGGMITTDDGELATELESLVDHGRDRSGYEHQKVGYNYRMSNVAGAIGRDQLRHLTDWVEVRQRNAKYYTNQFEELEQVRLPSVPKGRTHAYHQYTLRVPNRDQVTAALDKAEIGYGIYYPTPIPNQAAFNTGNRYPAANLASEEVLSLPVHPQVSNSDLERVVDVVTRALEGSD